MTKFKFSKIQFFVTFTVAGLILIGIITFNINKNSQPKTINKEQAVPVTQNDTTNPLKFDLLHLQDIKEMANCKSYVIKRGDVLNCTLEFKRNLVLTDINSIRFQLVNATDTDQSNSIKPLDFTCTGTNIATILNCNLDTSIIKTGSYTTFININGETQLGISENIKVN